MEEKKEKQIIKLEEELFIRKGKEYPEIALNKEFTRFIGQELIEDLLKDYVLTYKGKKIESYKELFKEIYYEMQIKKMIEINPSCLEGNTINLNKLGGINIDVVLNKHKKEKGYASIKLYVKNNDDIFIIDANTLKNYKIKFNDREYGEEDLFDFYLMTNLTILKEKLQEQYEKSKSSEDKNKVIKLDDDTIKITNENHETYIKIEKGQEQKIIGNSNQEEICDVTIYSKQKGDDLFYSTLVSRTQTYINDEFKYNNSIEKIKNDITFFLIDNYYEDCKSVCQSHVPYDIERFFSIELWYKGKKIIFTIDDMDLRKAKPDDSWGF